MYKIIGADGREYGPVTIETLRQWIAEGRANANTRVLLAGTTEWKLLSTYPEFAPDLAAKAAQAATAAFPSAAAPLLGTAAAEALARDILARGYDLQIGSCFGRGWDLVMRHFWLTVGGTFLVFLVSTAAGMIPFATFVLGHVFWGGLDWMILKLIRGQRAEIGDAFAGFSLAFVQLMLFSLVGQLLTSVGFLLCILPGIYLMVSWLMFTALLILDKRLEFWPAMELSRKVVTAHWWQVFGLLLLSLVLLLAGLLVCLVGFFIALPVVTAATVYAYEDIFNPKTPAGPTTLVPVAGAPVP